MRDGSHGEASSRFFRLYVPRASTLYPDAATGEIQFGPVIRSAQGDEVRYGATPFGGSQVRLSAYRTGGGSRGNVGSNTLSVLKSSIPFVASDTNRRAAIGGVDPEGIENVKLRAAPFNADAQQGGYRG